MGFPARARWQERRLRSVPERCDAARDHDALAPARFDQAAACHCGCIPASFTTFAHFAVSDLMKAVNCWGVEDPGSTPNCARRVRNSGSSSALTMSALILVMIG